MLQVAYHFHVMPRHHDHFRHAWHAAQDTLKSFIGLGKCQLREPKKRDQPFTVIFNWQNQANFERFTRTWVGVWAINGLGLKPDAFYAPTQTSINEMHSQRTHQCAA